MTDELFPAEPAKPKRPRARVMSPEEVASTASMAAQPDPNAPPTALAIIAEPSRGNIVLLDREKFEPFFDAVAEKVRGFEADVSTAKGRDALASFVFQEVTKVKTTLEKQANALTEEWRKNTAAVVAGRKEIVSRFEALAEEAKAPLTEWKAKEAERVGNCSRIIGTIKAAAVIADDDTSETVRQRGEATYDMAFDADMFGDMLIHVQDAKDAAVDALGKAYNRLKAAEDAAARLAQLEAAEAERQAKAQAEAAERQAREDAERESAAQAEAEAEEERRATAAREAELAAIEDAKREAAETAAQAERDKLQAAHDAEREAEKAAHEAELAEAREEAARAKRLQEAEASRVAEVERKRAEQEANDRRIAEEAAEAQRKRDEDLAHKKKVAGAMKAAILEQADIPEPMARAIVLALCNGLVPNTKVTF